MTGTPGDKIILCQPGNGQGCSVCCGLFNFRDISRHSLENFLNCGMTREREFIAHDAFTGPWSLRSRFSHICPYQGFLTDGNPGCLVHPLFAGTDGRDRSLFAHKICDSFFCPAYSVLSTEEKLFLIENISDWYLYSTAIADPETYSFIYNFVKEKYDDSCNRESSVLLVSEGLAQHSAWLRIYEGEIFFYSIPEYNLNKVNFSVRYRDDLMEQIVSRITGKAHSIL
jgi:hypothetical protein